MSTNKVYGDAPNENAAARSWRPVGLRRPGDFDGIDEDLPHRPHACTRSSALRRLAADVLAQEYGRYFGMKTGVFRGGCLTGPYHSGVELHGFLSIWSRCALTGGPYTIFGYKGKQVRDQIHSYDVIRAFGILRGNPRPGEVYNLGGGNANAASLLECVA